jgi:hypothetical protein
MIGKELSVKAASSEDGYLRPIGPAILRYVTDLRV